MNKKGNLLTFLTGVAAGAAALFLSKPANRAKVATGVKKAKVTAAKAKQTTAVVAKKAARKVVKVAQKTSKKPAAKRNTRK